MGCYLPFPIVQEYADNVVNSGVHGALLYYEQSNFTADMLASILDIPSNKLHVKKYLHTELNALLSTQEDEPIMYVWLGLVY